MSLKTTWNFLAFIEKPIEQRLPSSASCITGAAISPETPFSLSFKMAHKAKSENQERFPTQYSAYREKLIKNFAIIHNHHGAQYKLNLTNQIG